MCYKYLLLTNFTFFLEVHLFLNMDDWNSEFKFNFYVWYG